MGYACRLRTAAYFDRAIDHSDKSEAFTREANEENGPAAITPRAGPSVFLHRVNLDRASLDGFSITGDHSH